MISGFTYLDIVKLHCQRFVLAFANMTFILIVQSRGHLKKCELGPSKSRTLYRGQYLRGSSMDALKSYCILVYVKRREKLL